MAFVSSEQIEGKQRDLMDIFLEKLLAYLKKHARTQAHKDMAAWIESGRGVSGFICRKDVLRDMLAALEGEEIPNVVIRNKDGECGILVRDNDEKKIKRLTKQVLKEKSRFVKVVTRRELQENLVKEEGQDKTVLAIEGLTQEEAEYLITQIGRIYEGDEISIDETVGHGWTCCFAAKFLADDEKRKKEAKRIFLQMAMRFCGPNRDRNIKKERDEIAFRKLIASGFGTKDTSKPNGAPLWITGNDEKYLMVSEAGYEFGHIEVKDQRFRTIPHEKYERINYDFDKKLLSRCALLEDIQCTYNIGTAINRISKTPIGAARDESVMLAAKTDNAERIAAGLMDALIMKHTRNEPSMSLPGHWGEKIRAYKEEAAEVFEALATGELPKGYTEEELQPIINAFQKADHSPQEYSMATQELRGISAYARTAELERMHDPNNEVERILAEKEALENMELEQAGQDLSMEPGE